MRCSDVIELPYLPSIFQGPSSTLRGPKCTMEFPGLTRNKPFIFSQSFLMVVTEGILQSYQEP